MPALPKDKAGLEAFIAERKRTLSPEKFSRSKSVNKARIRLKEFDPDKFDLEAGGGREALLRRGVEDPTPETNIVDLGDISSTLNNFQDQLFEQAGAPETRAGIVAGLEPDTERPQPFKRLEEFNRLREEQGVAELETELNRLRSEQRDIVAENRARRFDAEGKPVPLGVISGRVSEIERQSNERLDVVNRQLSTITDQLNTSYGVIETFINLGSQDFQDATRAYNDEFNRNLQIYKLVDEEIDEQRATARANLQTYQNAIIKGSIDYNSLSDDQKVFVNKLELQSGLPLGFTASLKQDSPDSKVLSTTTRESGGQKFVDVVMRNPDGSMEIKTQTLGAVSTKTTDTKQDKSRARSIVIRELNSVSGSDGRVAPACSNNWS